MEIKKKRSRCFAARLNMIASLGTLLLLLAGLSITVKINMIETMRKEDQEKKPREELGAEVSWLMETIRKDKQEKESKGKMQVIRKEEQETEPRGADIEVSRQIDTEMREKQNKEPKREPQVIRKEKQEMRPKGEQQQQEPGSNGPNIQVQVQTSKTGLHNSSTTDALLLSNYDGSFDRPAWRCSSKNTSPSSTHKLLFVHVFKTAGTTFRTFFDNYGQRCRKGVSTIIRCSSVDTKSLNASDAKRNWGPTCTMKKTLTRDRKLININGKVSRSRLQKHTDIAIGHYPVGIHKKWIDLKSKKPIVPQYIAFFREPHVQYVSAKIFVHRDKRWSFEEAVKKIKSEIRRYNKEGMYYNAYNKYLMTPEQKDFVAEQEKLAKKNKTKYATEEKMVEVVKSNIIDMHILVGVVEHMQESLELIQSIIDVDTDLTDDFKRLLKPASSKGSLVENQSKLSSSRIVSALKEDEEIWAMMTEMLKHQSAIYEFAVKVHTIQVEKLRMKHGNRYSME